MNYSSKQIIDWGNYLNDLNLLKGTDKRGLDIRMRIGNITYADNKLNKQELLNDLNKYYVRILWARGDSETPGRIYSLDQFIINERDDKLNQLLVNYAIFEIPQTELTQKIREYNKLKELGI